MSASKPGTIVAMGTGSIGIPSRIAFFVCGLISALLSPAYQTLQTLGIGNGEWRVFSGLLIFLGGFAALVAVIPTSWVKRICRIGPSKQSPLSIPIKMLGGFAAFSYLLSVGLYFAPTHWHFSAGFVLSICPGCALSITVDPSIETVLFMLGPINAAVYGSFGGLLGYLFLVFRTCLARTDSNPSLYS